MALIRTRSLLGPLCFGVFACFGGCSDDPKVNATPTGTGGILGGTTGGAASTTCTRDSECPAASYCSAGMCKSDCLPGNPAAACPIAGDVCTLQGRCVPPNNTGGVTGIGVPVGAGNGGGGSGGMAPCVDVDVMFERQTPTVALVVDQSLSMCEDFSVGNRWDDLRSALIDVPNGVVVTKEAEVRFGLTLYSAPLDGFGADGCGDDGGGQQQGFQQGQQQQGQQQQGQQQQGQQQQGGAGGVQAQMQVAGGGGAAGASSGTGGAASGGVSGGSAGGPAASGAAGQTGAGGSAGEAGEACPTLSLVPPALNNLAAITAVYAPAEPIGATPTGETLAVVWPQLQAFTEPGPRYIVLATDGEPNFCGFTGMGTSPEGRQMVLDQVTAAFAAGIQTFVISVGEDVGEDHLREVANLGQGLPADDPMDRFYTATTAAELDAAFDEIIFGVRPCSFDLNGMVEPEDADTGIVTLDGAGVGYMDPNGWQLNGRTQIEFTGAACDAIQSGATDIEIQFPCGVFIPPPPE